MCALDIIYFFRDFNPINSYPRSLLFASYELRRTEASHSCLSV